MQRGTPTLGLHATTDIGNVRKTNEDTYVLAPNLLTRDNDVAASRSLVAVFDGHGGRRAAEYLETHCVRVFTESEAYGCDTKAALTATCQRLDAAFLALAADGGSFNDGATAIIVVVEQRHDASVVVTTANVGDSRALLCHVKQPPVALSVDQTAARDDEASRVYAAGGFVAYKNKFRPHIATLSGVKRRLRGTKEAWMRSLGRPLRVYPGGVMCSRSIGDLNCKQSNVLISDPEITEIELSTDHVCAVK
ncbi:hypothetical protein SPRG_09366 [Saprolegnia parasitica CBS 223.65]|uniref:PPM-type phosphatase domain-containing protein n=1 Tax=Saprolegnia parasitica (strain CBS 223.65) TaxID=695850 RepID=A0A067C3Q7_SAPPC|nr:hypothetical protein SPRG_09366 [Saprolegnia parasitica CBS 223.65]KDO25424.1 hypothetical protein SPRG_09366 [Saprolegnia parasitica CBS 223.65]|eukprot:XP_012203851.1 hypothetical protein SPRG_09366 [Saprolegnia parasitica CBS 223.65]